MCIFSPHYLKRSHRNGIHQNCNKIIHFIHFISFFASFFVFRLAVTVNKLFLLLYLSNKTIEENSLRGWAAVLESRNSARAPVLFSKKNLMVVSKQLVSFYCFVTQNIYCLVVKLLWLSLLYFKLAFYLFCFIFRLLFPVPFRVLFFHTHSVTNESVVDGFTTRSEKLL